MVLSVWLIFVSLTRGRDIMVLSVGLMFLSLTKGRDIVVLSVGLMFLSLSRGRDIQQHGSALRTQRRACRLRPPGVQTNLSGRGTRRHPPGCR